MRTQKALTLQLEISLICRRSNMSAESEPIALENLESGESDEPWRPQAPGPPSMECQNWHE